MNIPRFAILAIAALLVGCAPALNREKSYLKLLPGNAQDVRSQTIPAGFDYSIFLRAKIDRTQFIEFIKTVGLNEGGMQDIHLQEDEVRGWWNPRKNETYYGLTKRSEKSDAVRAILWATYEDGYLYFKYTDF